MTILLAGASGFLGRHVKLALEQAGHTVTYWDRNAAFDVDLTLSEPDLYINCAGNTEEPEHMYEDNVKHAYAMLEAARSFRKPLIHVGSANELSSESLYASTKRAATDLCLGYVSQYGVNVRVIRPSTMYGLGDKPSAFLPTLWRTHKAGTSFQLVEGRRDWVHVTDVASAIVLLVERPFKEDRACHNIVTCYNAGGDYVDNAQLVSYFEEAVGQRVDIDCIAQTSVSQQVYSKPLESLGWVRKITLERGVRDFVYHMQMEDQVWLGAEA